MGWGRVHRAGCGWAVLRAVLRAVRQTGPRCCWLLGCKAGDTVEVGASTAACGTTRHTSLIMCRSAGTCRRVHARCMWSTPGMRSARVTRVSPPVAIRWQGAPRGAQRACGHAVDLLCICLPACLPRVPMAQTACLFPHRPPPSRHRCCYPILDATLAPAAPVPTSVFLHPCAVCPDHAGLRGWSPWCS